MHLQKVDLSHSHGAHMRAEDMVVTDLQGKIIEGAGAEKSLRPSSDLDTHLHLYRSFPTIGAVVHTHSEFATSFAQAGLEIPAFGTTHADYFHGAVPVTQPLSDEAIAGRYVHETGCAIAERFLGSNGKPALDPAAVPACLVAGHAPFVWGKDTHEAVHHAVVLEVIARMAYRTLTLKAHAAEVSQALLDRHYFRKHGQQATYGQKTKSPVSK